MLRHLSVAIVMGILFFGLVHLSIWLFDQDVANRHILLSSIICGTLWGIEDWWRVRKDKRAEGE